VFAQDVPIIQIASLDTGHPTPDTFRNLASSRETWRLRQKPEDSEMPFDRRTQRSQSLSIDETLRSPRPPVSTFFDGGQKPSGNLGGRNLRADNMGQFKAEFCPRRSTKSPRFQRRSASRSRQFADELSPRIEVTLSRHLRKRSASHNLREGREKRAQTIRKEPPAPAPFVRNIQTIGRTIHGRQPSAISQFLNLQSTIAPPTPDTQFSPRFAGGATSHPRR
jgi:hypothetical protein